MPDMAEDMNGSGDLSHLMAQIKEASENIKNADNATMHKLEGIEHNMKRSGERLIVLDGDLKEVKAQCASLETSVNDIWKRTGRPGSVLTSDDDVSERKAAIEFLQWQHEDRIKKKDHQNPFVPAEEQIKSAITYRKALNAAMHAADHNTMPVEYRKSLSAFSFGTNAFVLTPQMTNRVIRCIVDPTDLGGLMDSMTTSSPSVRFLIDNARMGLGAWACEASCFANNPAPDLQEGLGELEIKPETIRMVVCATRDLIEDASINVENWILGRVSDGMRATINNTLLLGDGAGKPMGILNPRSGIPVCETSASTPPGQFSWQDLVMLRWEIPMQWQAGSYYLMNQRTFALLASMSDAGGRPMWSTMPGEEPGFRLAGAPIFIASQMPDVAPGSTPIAYGNFRQAYMIVWRKAVTMQVDPYTAGFCILYKFEARVGGGILCPNAVRLLRIR